MNVKIVVMVVGGLIGGTIGLGIAMSRRIKLYKSECQTLHAGLALSELIIDIQDQQIDELRVVVDSRSKKQR